jgi:hypothetical protein
MRRLETWIPQFDIRITSKRLKTAYNSYPFTKLSFFSFFFYYFFIIIIFFLGLPT